MMRKTIHFILSAALAACFFGTVSAQTTEFTYQGNLMDGASGASGNYDFEFRLFPVASGGSVIGTVQRLNTPVASGIFTVKLDFGNQFFGALRYLEIAVRPAGSSTFNTLSPRQQISNTPYAVQSITSMNSSALSGIGPGGFIQNTSTQQSANFNISGNGNIGGHLRVEGISNGNLASFGGNGDFQIDANGIVGGRFTVLQNGNVGIGIAAPLSKLTVAGTIESSSGGIKFPDGSAQTTAARNLYQTTNMSLDTGQIITSDNSPATLVPGLSQTINVSGNAKLLVQYSVRAEPNFCVACGASTTIVSIYLDGNLVNGRDQDVANRSPANLSGSWLLSVGTGSHTVEIRAASIGPVVAFGANPAAGDRSSLIVQVIPQ